MMHSLIKTLDKVIGFKTAQALCLVGFKRDLKESKKPKEHIKRSRKCFI